MHSAIVYAVMPENEIEVRNLVGRLYAGIHKVEKNPALKQLGEFVWDVDFQADPEVLAVLINALAQLGVGYGILQLDAAPQWMMRDPVQRNS